MDASSLLRHITANENRLINRNIIRVREKDIFHREECDRLADRPVFGKMESSENEIPVFDEIVDAFLFDEIRRITYFLAAGVARLKYFEFADWDNFVIFIYRNEKKTKKS